LVTPVEMISASYSSSDDDPSSPRTKTVRAARSTPFNVPWTVRTRSSARNRSNGIQLARAHSSGRLSRHPSSCPLTNAGLAEMPTTSACLARRMAVRTPLSPSPAMTMRLVTPFRLPYPGVTVRATMTHSLRRLITAALSAAALAAAPPPGGVLE
jgi:hypothetical protein